jgi:integrase
MRSTFKILFFLKRDKQKTNGMMPLFCRITVDGQEARFGMKCDVNPKHWDVKTGMATGRTAEAVKVNTLVDNTKAAIFKVYREMQERDNYVNAEKIKNSFLGVEQKNQTLLELFDLHDKERKEQIGFSVCEGTIKKYSVTRGYVADFLDFKYNLKDIPVKEVNKQFINNFEIYLFSTHHFAKNYIVSLMKNFRHIFEVALNKEWIFRNPFKDMKLRWQKVDRGFLTQAEIETLMDYRFEDEKLERTRDIFIFCSFTGLSYSDVKTLSSENIQSSTDGNLWIRGKRKKTATDYTIPLLNIPKMILEKYKGKTKNGFLLPVVHIVWNNRLLIKIGNLCGINKHLSSHLARHTFATLALTKGVSIETVAKMLGHTNIETTQIYAEITDSKIENEMSMFAMKIKKLDVKYLSTSVNEVIIDDVLQTLKIRTGKASDHIWDTLTAKVWQKMENFERHSFVSEMENMENKPKTMRDFYIALIDYFLENLNNQSDTENVSFDLETKLAVNF